MSGPLVVDGHIIACRRASERRVTLSEQPQLENSLWASVKYHTVLQQESSLFQIFAQLMIIHVSVSAGRVREKLELLEQIHPCIHLSTSK